MLLVLPGADAQVLESSVNTETGINKAASTSQKRVTRLAQQTADLLAEYRAVVRETESLKIYNDNLEKVVMDQREEVVSINQQLSGLEATNRGIVPLMLEMIDMLDKIVESDMPFRLEERRARVVRLTRHDGPGRCNCLGKIPPRNGGLPGGNAVRPNHRGLC